MHSSYFTYRTAYDVITGFCFNFEYLYEVFTQDKKIGENLRDKQRSDNVKLKKIYIWIPERLSAIKVVIS